MEVRDGGDAKWFVDWNLQFRIEWKNKCSSEWGKCGSEMEIQNVDGNEKMSEIREEKNPVWQIYYFFGYVKASSTLIYYFLRSENVSFILCYSLIDLKTTTDDDYDKNNSANEPLVYFIGINIWAQENIQPAKFAT
jgi:hypothetical protein